MHSSVKPASRFGCARLRGCAALAGSAFAREVFGEAVVDHYLHFFRTEQRKFDAVVTDWERRRYFEMA